MAMVSAPRWPHEGMLEEDLARTGAPFHPTEHGNCAETDVCAKPHNASIELTCHHTDIYPWGSKLANHLVADV